MHTSRLWRDVVTELGATDYPDVPLEHALVDSFAMTIVNAPETIDVVVTENTFGDILSDIAAAVTGGLGLAGVGIARGRRARSVRAGSRLGAPDRRSGDREPGSNAAIDGAPVPPRPRSPGGRRRDRARRGRSAARGAHTRSRGLGDDAGARRCSLARARPFAYPLTTMPGATDLHAFCFALFGFAFTG